MTREKINIRTMVEIYHFFSQGKDGIWTLDPEKLDIAAANMERKAEEDPTILGEEPLSYYLETVSEEVQS